MICEVTIFDMDRVAFGNVSQAIGIPLTAAQIDQFEVFEANLYRANETMNLTRVPREEGWLRHFADSLLVASLIPPHAGVLDIGTGPGFPSWPLACARPDLQIAALDSSGKMLGFLRANPLPNLRIVQGRAEEWGVRDAFDVVTGRAVAPLPTQLELSAPPAKVGGFVIPMRTPNDELAIAAVKTLGLDLQRIERRDLPGTDIVRVFPIYQKVKPTPTRYPRRWAEMKTKPL